MQVFIQWPNHFKKKVIYDLGIKQIIVNLTVGKYPTVVNAIWKRQDFKEMLLKKFHEEINNETVEICRTTTPSLLRKISPDNLQTFSAERHELELQERCPVLYRCLRSCAVSPEKEKLLKEGNVKTSKRPHQALSVASSVLLKYRNQQMSAQAYRIGVMLWNGGTKTEVICIKSNTKKNLEPGNELSALFSLDMSTFFLQ